MLQQELVALNAVVRLQQPSGTSLFDSMQRILHAVHCIICKRLACAYRAITSRNAPGGFTCLMKRRTDIAGSSPLGTS